MYGYMWVNFKFIFVYAKLRKNHHLLGSNSTAASETESKEQHHLEICSGLYQCSYVCSFHYFNLTNSSQPSMFRVLKYNGSF
jgi:hypothetical protein